jgi:hypoxanthine phosphoribosyltransferase
MTTKEHDSKIKRVIISEQEIQDAIKKAGAKISKEYEGKPLLLVSVLKGAFVFMADLCRAITIPLELDFMSASSYGAGTVSSGTVRIDFDLKHDISNYHVIIVEDIVDSGNTLSFFTKELQKQNPTSLKICTFLDKKERRQTDITPDYCCFEVPDLFIVGYGLDFAEKYRELPFVAELINPTL